MQIEFVVYVAPGAQPVLQSSTPLLMNRSFIQGGWSSQSNTDSQSVQDVIAVAMSGM